MKLFDNLTEITGTSEYNLEEFPGTSGKTLTATAAPAGTTITGSIAKFDGSTWTQISGGTVSGTTPVTVNLPALGTGNEERYKITLKAQLSGYDDSDPEDFFIKLVKYEVPGLKIKQDFHQIGDYSLYCISAGTKAYITEDIIPDAGQYNSSENSLVIYSMLNGKCKLELSADLGTAVKYKLDSGTEQSSSAPAEITVSGGAHTLEVWTVRGTTEGPHTTVYIKVVNAVSSYGELKNLVKNAPEKGSGYGQYDYNNFIHIRIDSTTELTADSEIAVTGGKKLMLSSSLSGIVRTINANNSRRIFKVSGTGTGLILENIKLEGGFASDGKGGAVCVEAGCTLELTEKTVITPSTAPYINTKGKNDVYLARGTSIKVDSNLTGTTPANPIAARITPNYTDGNTVLTGGMVSTNYTKFSVTQPLYATNLWTIKNDGTLKAIPTIINGGSGAWQRLKEAVEALPEGSTITINGTITATNDSGGDNRGQIIITKNLTIQGQSGADSDILDASSLSRIFTVQSSKKLTLKKLTLKNGQPLVGKSGGAILVQTGCTADLSDCIIEGCKTGTGGDGGAMSISGTAKLTRCTVKKCVAEKNGGGLYVYGGILTLSDSTIGGSEAGDGNKAADGDGGGICISSGRFFMNSGEISGNTGDKGGGVGIVSNSYFYMEGGTIKKNSASKGGGVFVNGYFGMKNNATVTLSTGDDEDKAGKNDVYLFNYKLITLMDNLTGIDFPARITPENHKEGIKVLGGSLVSSHYHKFKVTPKGTQKWYVDNNGNLKKR